MQYRITVFLRTWRAEADRAKKIAPITQWMGINTERYGSEDKSEGVWF
jgi:hypothetical protein